MVRWRGAPEDFRVDEVPLYAATGEGSHTFVRVEKRLLTTDEAARALARAAGVRARDVGFAGRKDRVAVSTQWFSVPGWDPARARAHGDERLRVLETRAHPHKLRTGHLRGNRFEIVLRDVSPEERAAAVRRWREILAQGMPNRFGAQRFGRDARNAARGARVLCGAEAPSDRRRARLWLSALQAAVFNEVLAERPLPLSAVERGDVAFVHATGGRFQVEDPEREAARAAAFEISATGPIFGTRAMQPAGAVAERERKRMAAHGLDPDALRAPRGIRMRGSRRPVRVRPADAALDFADDRARLRCELPAGSYASVLVEELFPGAREGAPEAIDSAGRPGVS